MKAMIFAAGLGTRLRPLTDTMPKALVPVGGKPMLERVIRHLIECGFNDIVINVHHFGQLIIDFLEANHNFGAKIRISDERGLLLDTGGGILAARPLLDDGEPFLVHNADILTDLDLRAFYRTHIRHNADATLLTARRSTSRYLLLDEASRLHGWINKKTGETRPENFTYVPGQYHEMAFGGIHVISPTLFDRLSKFTADPKFSIIPFYLSVCNDLKIMGYTPTGSYRWFDIGKPETLAQAEKSVSATE